MKRLQVLLMAGILLYACSSPQSQTEQITLEKKSVAEPEEQKSPEVQIVADPLMQEGEANYKKYCMTCHMEDGYGVPNLNPPLAETDWVTGDVDRLIGIVLNGKTGEIEVNGELYNGVMIPHKHLNDREISTILTYIRAGFGNNAGSVSEEQVAKARAAS